MVKREKLRAFHRETILEVAEKLFYENGENVTTMDLIAKEAGYSKTTVYTYFKSKKDIYHAITLKSMKEWKRRISQQLKQHNTIFECYFAICEALADFSEESPLAFRTLTERIDLNLDDPILKEIYDVGEEINQVIAEVLQKGIAEKILSPKMNIPETILLIWSASSGIIAMSNEKAAYIQQATGKSKKEIQHAGFQLLLNGLVKESNK